MLHFDKIVFGPVHSRRLGSSLGVNLLPSDGKLCNFDCIYCECGWNRDNAFVEPLPTAAQVKEALELKLSASSSAGEKIDSITFSGNGEPTLNPDFAEIIDITIALRDKYMPSAKVSVLSNATRCAIPEIRSALRKVDNPDNVPALGQFRQRITAGARALEGHSETFEAPSGYGLFSGQGDSAEGACQI